MAARLRHDIMAARLRHDCHGATAVEFAMLLPVLLALLFGALEFGRAMWLRQDLQFAVEEAARFALAEETASATAISARALSRIAASGPSGAIQVATAIDAESVTVTATTNFTPVVSGLLPAGIVQLSARARLPR